MELWQFKSGCHLQKEAPADWLVFLFVYPGNFFERICRVFFSVFGRGFPIRCSGHIAFSSETAYSLNWKNMLCFSIRTGKGGRLWKRTR